MRDEDQIRQQEVGKGVWFKHLNSQRNKSTIKSYNLFIKI